MNQDTVQTTLEQNVAEEKDPIKRATMKTNAIRAFRNKYGVRPSHFGKPKSYFK